MRDETEVAPQCIQKVKYSMIEEAAGEEDCLYMNIYSPKVRNKKNSKTAHICRYSQTIQLQ